MSPSISLSVGDLPDFPTFLFSLYLFVYFFCNIIVTGDPTLEWKEWC